MPRRVLVFGSRDWTDADLIGRELDLLVARHGELEVIEGEARGADRLARAEAERRGMRVRRFPADWRRYARADGRNPAGAIRNQQMLDFGRPDEAIGFHDNIDTSLGSADMRGRCYATGVPVRIVSHQ